MVQKLMEVIRLYAVREYFFLRAHSASRKSRQIKYLLLLPCLLLLCAIHYGMEIIGYLFKTKEEKKNYKYELTVVAIAKNEGPYIAEWIEYHILKGADRFVIYDNESTDNMREVLQKYIDQNIVEYIWFPGVGKQLDAYYDALKRYKRKSKYMAYIDLDEFIVSREDKIVDTIEQIMNRDSSVAGVAANWCVYGSSGHKEKPEGLVIANYLYRANPENEINRCVKTIVNPRKTRAYIMDPHTPTYKWGYHGINETGNVIMGPWNEYPNNSTEVIRINHYYCKSEAEGKLKFARGLATHENGEKNPWEKYVKYDQNDILDEILLPYVQMIKDKLE